MGSPLPSTIPVINTEGNTTFTNAPHASDDDSRSIDNFLARERLKFINSNCFSGIANLNISTCNVHGLKTASTHKLYGILELMTDFSVGLLAITDSNLNSSDLRFNILPSPYRESFHAVWAPSDNSKSSGLGVGLIMNARWRCHY